MGNHPEDILNDQTVKQGFIDKIPVSQNETSTARQSLYGLFKHRSGLQTLSALFASVVEKRQTHTKISSGSAFKPPPRVTLTEAKRKTWLTDLANRAIPLRRLSRTIPQGIRGQTLLDQCFANNVPMGRALWFAKCVGANEIRTLKRKGPSASFAAGAEIKWLRDWTSNVEQFFEDSIDRCGQANWRSRMNYAFCLAVRHYSESLLDRENYLDWIVKSMSSASSEYLPVWLLMVNIHKSDLLKHRKRGRFLAESLLEKLRALTGNGQSPMAPLVGRLKQVLRSITEINICCFVMPQSWAKYKNTLANCLDLNAAPAMLLLEQLSYRNERLSIAPGHHRSELHTQRQMVIDILDSASSPFDIRKTAHDCRVVCDDTELLIRSILEWCSSSFRVGKYRVYLGIRLLKLYLDKVDINSTVIEFLASQQTQTSCDTLSLCLLISELVRSQVFSLSRYIQWVTARGGLRHNYSGSNSPALCLCPEEKIGRSEYLIRFDPVQVLTAVPPSSLKPAVRNLRHILLARAGFSIEQELNLIQRCRDHVATKLPRMVKYKVGSNSDLAVPDFSKLSWSVRSETGVFLKQHIASSIMSVEGSVTKDRDQALPTWAVTDTEFRLIRSICEGLGDLPVLVDIIKLCVTSENEQLLASVTDTVNYHHDTFSALGAFHDLHSRLFRAYLSMRSGSGLPRRFIHSLISLGYIVPSNLISVTSLQQDLARGDRTLAVAACSPVSDGMAECLQQAGPTFTEEFEAVLSTGNRMEEQTMTQLFNVLAGRLEKGQYQTQAENDEILCALHARLRIYRIAQFDDLIAAWLQKLLVAAKSRVEQLLPVLISTGCASFEACVDILIRVMESQKDPSGQALLMHPEVANFLAMIDAAEKDTDPISYKIKLGNARHIKDNPGRAMELRIRAGLSEDASRSQPWNELLIRLVLKGRMRDALPLIGSHETIATVLNNLLQLSSDGSHFVFSDLLKKTEELSMPFCRLRLQMWANCATLLSLTGAQEALAEALFDLAKSGRDNTWIYYTTAIGAEVACKVRQKAEEAFFALPMFPVPGRNLPLVLPIACIEQASNYLRIVSRTAYSIPPPGFQVIAPMLVERFVVVLRALGAGRIPANNNNTRHAITQSASPSEESISGNLDHLTSYLMLLLQMTSIHRSAFISSRAESLSSPIVSQKQSQQDVVKILALLTKIALHPSLKVESGVVGHILDVAATIVDDASEEVRILCARILKDKMHDQRVDHLFGSANTNDIVSVLGGSQTGSTTDGLQIMKDGKRVGEYRSRNWEMLEGGVEASISLSLFDARREVR